MHAPHPDWLRPDWPAPAQVQALCTTRAGGCSRAPFDSLNLGDHVGDDPHYRPGKASGGDALDYVIPLADLPGEPVAVQAILHYQATPPFYLQDRFCTAKGPDRDRLYFLAGHLNLDGSAMQDWRFEIVSSGVRPIGQ